MNAVLQFLAEAKVELSRVNWPTRKQIMLYTVLVIVISLFVAFFLGSLDYLFSTLVTRFLIK
ncbi:MAG: preprotein translocase subunit SecE [Candidatus Moranbacteria bacterium]|nr:preprotein translocase subunit SecE [Candidatus Moranbacteria bacterium]OIQ02432.1 MAG: preprotein translocase subunit SecE [Candidatus Moranbacteria bacterium CG2_30_41_165]PIP25448.1 MAG: preprotein translocase subunit SecE [Candidatus Moranbacteria bacterium CG23_combo_of_CG06-09_8_20_14_all_41_28]PIV86178.1 MAG: preprotein translocase subunit SecE [Candidatus Moranbacteria bacterium CG17_big_fil_post_rev_8_21_14_2_50_41_107]PIW94626.1 MAG: preprotein translocase subunit SecE [Candidatus 